MEKTLYIPKKIIDKYNQLMQPANGIVDYEKNDIPRYATVESWTVDFGDGYEVDIKVCSSNYDEPLWCEGVLFLHGCEVCFTTDVDSTLDGEYWFFTEPENFIVYVKPKEETQNHTS